MTDGNTERIIVDNDYICLTFRLELKPKFFEDMPPHDIKTAGAIVHKLKVLLDAACEQFMAYLRFMGLGGRSC